MTEFPRPLPEPDPHEALDRYAFPADKAYVDGFNNALKEVREWLEARGILIEDETQDRQS